MQRAIFFDKDGTLIENLPYNVDPSLIRFMPGAAAALVALYTAGYRLFIISNQSGVARGYFAEAALAGVQQWLASQFSAIGVVLDGFSYCPHHPAGRVAAYTTICNCRKPAPGMLLQAARDHQIDLGQSWMIGDILDDVEAGHRAACKTMLVNNGGETEWVFGPLRKPHIMVRDLAAAADVILATDAYRPIRRAPAALFQEVLM
ncbi:MAG: HAD family hydrolase [Chloroflexaceae bacterium]|nr:HAD family hydrolase [Chloroflexaceae bacterium]NJO04120.1 HAD family hydrolase [Chloroflexaceae bacterium]